MGLLSNFLEGPVIGTNVILSCFTLTGLWLCLGAPFATSALRFNTRLDLLLAILFAGLIGLATWESRWIGSSWLVSPYHALRNRFSWLPFGVLALLAWLVLAGSLFVTRHYLRAALKDLLVRFKQFGDLRWLAITVLVPWMLLVAVTEPGRMDRHWWLLALQMPMLATVVVSLYRKSRHLRWLAWVGIVALIALNPMIIEGAGSWARGGWSGDEAPDAQVAEYLAARFRSNAMPSRVGYEYPQARVSLPSFDMRLEPGASIDALLRGHGVDNANRCAEGQSSDDDYKVVDTSVPGPYFDAPSPGRFSLVKRFGNFEIHQRESAGNLNSR
jgi:hypothetical protein